MAIRIHEPQVPPNPVLCRLDHNPFKVDGCSFVRRCSSIPQDQSHRLIDGPASRLWAGGAGYEYRFVEVVMQNSAKCFLVLVAERDRSMVGNCIAYRVRVS